jgi:hypothetical protein
MTRRLMSHGIVCVRYLTVSSLSYPASKRKKGFFLRLAPHRKQRLRYENQQQLYIKMDVDVCKMAVIFIQF